MLVCTLLSYFALVISATSHYSNANDGTNNIEWTTTDNVTETISARQRRTEFEDSTDGSNKIVRITRAIGAKETEEEKIDRLLKEYERKFAEWEEREQNGETIDEAEKRFWRRGYEHMKKKQLEIKAAHIETTTTNQQEFDPNPTETTESSNNSDFDPPCSGPLNKGRDYVIIFDRSGLSNKEYFVNLTQGFMNMINPWETKNRVALITYSTDANVDIAINSMASREEVKELLNGITLVTRPGDLMLAMRTANEKVLDGLPWLEQSDKEKVVIILMADDSSVGTSHTGEKCSHLGMANDGLKFDDCMQRGYAHQRALMTAKYGAQIFLVAVDRKYLITLKYVAPIEDIVHIENFKAFSQHPMDEFARRFCQPVRKTIN